jgi:hypothetical protein
MSRISRTLTLVVVAAGSVLLPATAALAQVPRPLPAGDSSNGIVNSPVTPVTVVTGGNSGLATWAIVLIAVGAVVLGALAAASFRAVRRHTKTGALATA